MSFDFDKSSAGEGAETPPRWDDDDTISQDTAPITPLKSQNDSRFEMTLGEDDPLNPQSWSSLYRYWVIGIVSFSAWVVVLYSTSYMSCLPDLELDFQVSHLGATTGLTSYLLGLAVGSLLSAPLSELYGRRIVYIGCFSVWALLVIPCGLAESFCTVVASRAVAGIFAAALVANGPGSIFDVSKPEGLALGMSFYSLGPFSGPVLGPLIGGVVFEHLGREWTNWIILILGGVGVALMLTVKETYAPEILRQKVARQRKKTGDERWWCRHDHRASAWEAVRLNLCRPLSLYFKEPMVLFINTWNALIYGILYLCFVAYPVVFSEGRGWGPTASGACYLGIGVGIALAVLVEPLIRRLVNSQPKDPRTGLIPPEAVAIVMVIGSLLTPIGQIGFAWTCLPQKIHWVVPILFGIPFGAGNTLSFIYSNSYLARAYGMYTASAMASNAVMRSIFGATLPLAGASMYAAMSPQAAGSLCGGLLVLMIPIPFVFWRYGATIRGRSKVIRDMER